MWFLITIILAFSALLWFAFRHVSAFSFENINSLGDDQIVIKKARILSVCAIVLNLAIDFFHRHFNSGYVIDWYVNVLATLVAVIVLAYTYRQPVNIKILAFLKKGAYVLICAIYIYRASINRFDPAISTEVCIIFVYSLIIFSDLRNILIFVGFVGIASSLVVYFIPGSGENKTIFISATVQALLMLFLFIFIESKKLSKVLFSDIILSNSQYLIFVADNHGKIIYVNRFAKQAFDIDQEHVLGNDWWKFTGTAANEIPVYRQQLVNNIKKGISIKRQQRLTDPKTGAEKVISWRETPIGQSFMLLVGEDITEELKQNEELEKLSLVAKTVNNGVVITDADNRIEWVNDSFLNLMGYTLPELIGKRPIDVFSGPGTDQEIRRNIQLQGLSKDVEFMQYTKEGKARWLLVNNSSIYDEKGKLIRQVEIITDVTERRYLERRFSYILQNASDIIYTSNIAGNFDFVNPTVTQILGYEPEEILGKHFSTLICEDDKERVSEFYFRCFRAKENDTYLEFQAVAKDGSLVWVSQTVNFIFDEHNNIAGFQAIVRDITSVKEAELEKIRKYERQQRFNRVLADLSLKPYETYGSLDTFLTRQCFELTTALNTHRVGLWFMDGERFFRRCAHSLHPENGDGETELLRDEFPVYFSAIASGQVLKVDDVTTHPAVAEFGGNYLEAADITAMMDMPILLDGKLIGIVCCEDTGGVRHWTEEEEAFVKGMADLIAINLEAEKRRMVENAIKESENNFRLLNETIDDVFWLYDLVEHRILYVSPSSEKVLGIAPQEYYKTDNYWVNYILDEDKPMILKAHQVIEEKGYYEVEYRIRKPDGNIHWIYEKSFGIKDGTGNYVKSSGLCSDITSRKESQAFIEKLSLVAEKTTNSIIITNNKEEIIWVNQAFEKLTGYCFAEVIGKNPSRLLQGQETSPESQEAIREILSNNRSGHVEIVNYNKQGQAYWTSLQIDPVFDAHGNCIYYISVESDITSQKQAELELKESKNKLDGYARYLELQDTVKGRLIHSQNMDEITSNVLGFLDSRLSSVAYLSLFVIDEKKQNLVGKRYLKGEMEREVLNLRHVKSFETLRVGNVYIEKDLGECNEVSESDNYLTGIGARSYIVFPLMSLQEFVGAMAVAFSAPYALTSSEESSLLDISSMLSVTVRQVMLKDKIFEQNKDLNDSLKYAQNIQASILPLSINRGIIYDTAIVYLPKAHVSGDFYWFEEVDGNIFQVVGDCTGHGVPGAFLTLLANTLLQKNIVEAKLTSPSAILARIDEEIYYILNRNSGRQVRDGMELAISVIDSKERTLTFSGAGIGLTCFAGNDEPIIIRGSAAPIGDYQKDDAVFKDTVLQLQGGEQFFMYSDGYQDQLGGPNNKRLSKKTFLAYLSEIRRLPALQQQEVLMSNLRAHQRQYTQTDDITVLGFKIR